MNQAQWLWEYHALREREKESFSYVGDLTAEILKAVRLTLIQLLGLNLLQTDADLDEDKKKALEDGKLFTPLSLLVANEEVLRMIVEKHQDDSAVAAAIGDEEFEELSAAIARGDDLGDMEPIVEGTAEEEKFLAQWFTPEKEYELKTLGINITDKPSKPAVHISVDGGEIQRKKREANLDRKKAEAEVKKQMEAERKQARHRDVTISFDDNAQ